MREPRLLSAWRGSRVRVAELSVEFSRVFDLRVPNTHAGTFVSHPRRVSWYVDLLVYERGIAEIRHLFV